MAGKLIPKRLVAKVMAASGSGAKQDQDKLQAELTALQAQHENLKQQMDEVEARIAHVKKQIEQASIQV